MAVVCAARCATGSAGHCAPSLRVTASNAARAVDILSLRPHALPRPCILMAIPCNGSRPPQRLNADFADAAGVIYSGGVRGPTASRFGLARLTGQPICTLRSKCLPALRAITTICRTHQLHLTNCAFPSANFCADAATRSITTAQTCLMSSEVHQGKQRHTGGAQFVGAAELGQVYDGRAFHHDGAKFF